MHMAIRAKITTLYVIILTVCQIIDVDKHIFGQTVYTECKTAASQATSRKLIMNALIVASRKQGKTRNIT